MNHKPLALMQPIDTIPLLPDTLFPPYITLAHLFNAPQNWDIKQRTLTQYQFQYVIKGSAEYTIEQQSYATNRGDLIYHCPNEKHSVRRLEHEPYICFSILFHFGTLDFPVKQLIGPHHYLGNFSNHPIEYKLSQLVTCYHQPGIANQIHCQGLLLEILYALQQWTSEQAPKSRTQEKTISKLILIKNYLTDHFSQDLNHTDLEHISGLSRNYIIVKFKKAFGMTPFEYVSWVRIERAKELVVNTSLSIGEIANQVGYADVHTFGKMFKNKTSVSLSQFCSSMVVN